MWTIQGKCQSCGHIQDGYLLDHTEYEELLCDNCEAIVEEYEIDGTTEEDLE